MECDFIVCEDQTIQYTSKGRKRYANTFAEHGIDIGAIKTWRDHYLAVQQCASEALSQLEFRGISSPERQILKALMSSPGNERANALIREEEAIKRRQRMHIVSPKL